MRLVLLAAVGAAAYYVITRCAPDPRTWPAQAQEDVARLKANLAEAVAAGRRAAARREQELMDELGTVSE